MAIRLKEKRILSFILVAVALCALFVFSINRGSMQVSYGELFRGLFLEENETVSIIFDLRFPRIIIAVLSGAALAVSGVLFQAVLKNPLADPGIIGISSGRRLHQCIDCGVCADVVLLYPCFRLSRRHARLRSGVWAFL